MEQCVPCWCAWKVSYVVDGCNEIAAEYGRYDLPCMQKLWSASVVLGLYGLLECKLCDILIILRAMSDCLIGCYSVLLQHEHSSAHDWHSQTTKVIMKIKSHALIALSRYISCSLVLK